MVEYTSSMGLACTVHALVHVFFTCIDCSVVFGEPKGEKMPLRALVDGIQ